MVNKVLSFKAPGWLSKYIRNFPSIQTVTFIIAKIELLLIKTKYYMNFLFFVDASTLKLGSALKPPRCIIER